jgi:hypothetical protein
MRRETEITLACLPGAASDPKANSGIHLFKVHCQGEIWNVRLNPGQACGI